MLLGEFEQRLDDKNRVTLPARLREHFADGVVCARGFDGCVAVWPRAAWDEYVNEQNARLDGFSREGRLMQRYLFGGAQPGELDRQGRVALPAPLLAARAAWQGHRHRRSAGPARDLGPRGLAPPARRGRRERRECCRTSCPAQALTRTCRCWRSEVVALLDVHPGELIVDCTFGAGGHSRLLARELEGSGQLVAIDRDPTTQPFVDALRATVGTGVQMRPMHGPFAACLRRLLDEGAQAGAVLMDLGMSSMQVDAPARGFSYTHDAPLDMRMDPERRDHRRGDRERVGRARPRRRSSTATARSASRARSPARSSQERAHDAVRDARCSSSPRSSAPSRRPRASGTGHPAKRVFQALRIAVNDELGQLEDGLESALELCEPGGRLAVIAFHSLEDRMVKQRFVKAAKGCICPPDLPVCGCGRTPEFRLVTSKAVRPSADEVAANPRAASARLRVVQREVTA